MQQATASAHRTSDAHAAPTPLRVVRTPAERPEADEPEAEAAEPAEPEGVGPAELDESGFGLVGSLVWTLAKGDLWVLSPESAFLFTDCWRKTLVREAWMLPRPVARAQMRREAVASMARRWITGEPMLLDLYVAERDGAELGISSDELGGNLYATHVDRGDLVCRKTVHFGSQKGVRLEAHSPLEELRRGMGWRQVVSILKRAAYGPGWIFQRYVALGDEEDTLILQIDGDLHYRELAAGETVRTDPRHAYAWDASVSWRLCRFGHVTDRLLRGSIPFQVEFEGPGRVWLSDMSFADGYLGSVFTPSHWIYHAGQLVRRVLGALNPFSWI